MSAISLRPLAVQLASCRHLAVSYFHNGDDQWYVCMYVRIYVCMYVSKYVCMYVCIRVKVPVTHSETSVAK